MADDAVIILDPVNAGVIEQGLARGLRTFVGGNCTVSLMLMAVAGLLQAGLVEWMTTMTYQAASGGGAAKMLELVKQMGRLVEPVRKSPSENALEVDRMVIEAQRSASLPTRRIRRAAGRQPDSLDRQRHARRPDQRRVERHGRRPTRSWAFNPPVPVDGICVRVGTMRCHSQALGYQTEARRSAAEIEQILAGANEWVRVVPNNKESTLRCLTPTAVSGTLNVPVGVCTS